MAIITHIVEGTTPNLSGAENRGKVVKATAHGGRVIERIVWEETDDLVYLCSQRCYDQLCTGDASIRPVGFPRGDVTGLSGC